MCVLPVTDDTAFTSASTDNVRWHDTIPASWRHECSTGADGGSDELIGIVHIF